MTKSTSYLASLRTLTRDIDDDLGESQLKPFYYLGFICSSNTSTSRLPLHCPLLCCRET